MMVNTRGGPNVQQPSAAAPSPGPWPPGNYQQSGQNPLQPYGGYPQPPYPPQSPGGYHGGMPPPSYSPAPAGSQDNPNYSMYNPQGQQFTQMQHQPHNSTNYPPHPHPGSLGAPSQHPSAADNQPKQEQPDSPSPEGASRTKQENLTSPSPLPLPPSDTIYRGSKTGGDTAEI